MQQSAAAAPRARIGGNHMKWRSLLMSALVIGIALSVLTPAVMADHDDDDDYYSYNTYRPYYRSYVSPYGYAGPYGYRVYSSGPVTTYRTYSTYDPYLWRGYRYHDADGYRYYRDSTGSVIGRVVLNAILNNIH